MSNNSGGFEHSLYHDLQNGIESDQLKKIQIENRIVKHNYKKAQNELVMCELEGCPNMYEILLIPNQMIYPKYCPIHRSKYRRDHDIGLEPKT